MKTFKEEENQKVLKRLLEAGLEIEEMPEQKGILPLKGKTFVFTGSLEKYTRAEAENVVESLGARAASSVSGSTDFVVAGEEPGSKLDEAKKHGVKVIDEAEFEKLISQK